MIAWLLATAWAGELDGTWRIDMEVRSRADVPVIRHTSSTTVTVGLVTVRTEGDRLVHEQVSCDVQIDDGNPLARTALSPGLVAGLGPTVAPVDASDGRYVVDLGVSHLGYDPALTGSLPTDPADPAVRDVDGDGRPGATVTLVVVGVGRFRMDVVQRSHAVLDGRVGPDGVTGTVRTLDFAQAVLSADAGWLRRAPVVTHDDAASTFRMTRVPDGTTCADLELATVAAE